MAQAIVTSDLDAVVSEIEVSASPERVFQALTDAKRLISWWGRDTSFDTRVWEMEARIGGRWRFEIVDRSGHAINGVTEFKAHGEIVEFDPPRLLSYTWIANWHDQPTARTLVRWELATIKNGTRVKVTHSGLAQLPVVRRDYAGGWPGVLQKLKDFVA